MFLGNLKIKENSRAKRKNQIMQVIEEINSLKRHSRERKKIRRRLFKIIRENEHLFRNDRIMRKIHGGWLGDLSDTKLIEYCTDYLLERTE